jgi:transposase
MMERSYSTDLTDAEWEYTGSYIPAPNKRGRWRIHSTREILNGVFYVLKSGCPWRLLPRKLPPWETVYFSENTPYKHFVNGARRSAGAISLRPHECGS